jgi:hypothetical protein
MSKFDTLSSANILALNAASDRDRLVVHLFTEMAEKNRQLEQEISQWRDNADTTALRLAQLEVRLDKLSDLTVGDELSPFDERVLEVLDVRSGTAFEHLEAEIDEKLCDFIDSYSFTEAVVEASGGSLSSKVEEILDGLLHDAIIDAIGDPEDIVRKGLRSIL